MKHELVDVLTPPAFAKSGEILTREDAIALNKWIGVFNLWIVQTAPVPSIIYQQRSPHKSWAPLAFDVSVAGHLIAGEEPRDGIREATEELGVTYSPESLLHIGRKLHVGTEYSVIDIFMVEDNSPLDQFVLQKDEVFALARCSIEQLIALHQGNIQSFTAPIRYATGETACSVITPSLFPFNWDPYHYKMALLALKFCHNEFPLLY